MQALTTFDLPEGAAAGAALGLAALVCLPIVALAADVQRGRASYYDEPQRVACGGARFNPEGMTAAHRSLPCGTRVRVTSNAGRSVVVTINDRGPAKWTGRIIDLALAPARLLGMIGPGHIPVTVEVLR
jgi:rare lipoprotein A